MFLILNFLIITLSYRLLTDLPLPNDYSYYNNSCKLGLKNKHNKSDKSMVTTHFTQVKQCT